ncbi:ExbD/TolR family protein [Arenibaculum sp.]|jgi:biopolymer transport protein TolR|uniref:ExbD/TolR family protein n=1 Tax=Arenibaculum sp. TaxID=2865862 RepID=UPI002E105A34|nr:ExbD/TolR family protein [Arenibaculum sp.]
MGAQLSGRGGGRGRRRSYTPLSEINVTPFVDVMLVLLIVFMVAAPLMSVGVPVDLPRTAAPPLAPEKEPLFVSVTPDGRVWVQESEVEIQNLVSLLTAVTGANPEARILVRGDQTVAYGRMLEVMGTMSAAGFTKVGLVADLPTPTAAAR